MTFDIFPESTPIFAGISHWFLQFNLETIRDTWIAMAVLFVSVLLVRWYMQSGFNLVTYAAHAFTNYFVVMCQSTLGYFDYGHFTFITSLFLFTFIGNIIGLLPFVAETTKDLNTTLVIGSLSFLYVQVQKIRVHGWKAFALEYVRIFHFSPRILAFLLSIVASILLLPFTLLGELSKVVSLSFRLFGNILGGAVLFEVLLLWLRSFQGYFIVGIVVLLVVYAILSQFVDMTRKGFVYYVLISMLGIAFLVTAVQAFFVIFEGLIQAYVIATLTATYLGVALAHEQEATGGVL